MLLVLKQFIFSLIILSNAFLVEAQDAIVNSNQKRIDSADLSWHARDPTQEEFILIQHGVRNTIRFSVPLTFQIWEYRGLDSALIANGKWGINPGGWLVLMYKDGTAQKFGSRSFVNFTFIMKDSEMKQFENDFIMSLGGLPLVKGKGRILNQAVIDACWKLADRYYVHMR